MNSMRMDLFFPHAKERSNGFTLVELIVSLLLVGLITVLAGMAFAPFIEGYIDTRNRAEITQKAQIAMTRIVKEFKVITSVTTGTATSITFDSQHSGGTETHTFSWSGTSGDPLMLDSDILTDQVADFQLAYLYFTIGGAEVQETSWTAHTEGMEIRLTMQGANNVYATRVYPRNL